MKITAEKDQQSQYIVTIELDPSELDEAKGRAAKKLANQLRIPGFRPGKAPRALVERYVGQESLLEQATRDLLPKAYQNAIKQEDIKPIGDPQFDITSKDPFTIVATIPVEPTVELGQYKDLRFELPSVNIGDEEVEKVIQQLVDQQSTWEAPETARPAQEGDQVELELQTIRDGEVTGQPFQRSGVLGKGELLMQIDEQIAGMSIGEEKIVEVKRQTAVTKPATTLIDEAEATADTEAEATEAPEAAEEAVVQEIELPEVETLPLDEEEEVDTTPMTFKAVLNTVKIKREPEVNDDFVQSVSDLQTLDELKARIRTNLEAQQTTNNKRELTDKIIKEAVAISHIEMPPVLIDAEIHALEENMAQRLKQQKLSLDQYLQFSGKDHAAFHEELRPQAEERIKTALVLREIARTEDITVEQGELDREVEKMVDEYTLTGEEDKREERAKAMRGYLNQEQTRDSLREELFSRKLSERLVELVTGIKAVEPEPLELIEKTPDQKAELSLEVDSPSVTGELEAPSPAVSEEVEEAQVPAKKGKKAKAADAEATE